jgi:hypothetical protein
MIIGRQGAIALILGQSWLRTTSTKGRLGLWSVLHDVFRLVRCSDA